MHYIRLGQTGAVVSRICLGLMSYSDDKPMYSWMLDAEKGEQFVQQALDAGITFFDTAETYSNGGSERFFGTALKKLLPQSRYTREDLFIASKILPQRTLKVEQGAVGGIQKGLSRKAIHAAIDGTLQRLQLDYLDLYLLHRYDPNTAPEETMQALHQLVVAGKVRYIGASAMYLWQFCRYNEVAERNGWTKFSVMQDHYNAIYREEEREMIPYCIDHGIATTPYSPLASGLLTRLPSAEPTSRSQNDPTQKMKYHRAGDELVIEAVRAVATARSIPQAQVAMAWLLVKQGVTAPIIGATKVNHIADAVQALSVKLTEEEVRQIDTAYTPHAISGHM